MQNEWFYNILEVISYSRITNIIYGEYDEYHACVIYGYNKTILFPKLLYKFLYSAKITF